MKADKLETEPMFEVDAPPPAAKSSTFPGPRTIRRVRCPAGNHKAGLIAGAADPLRFGCYHLVWREHLVRGALGGSWWCTAGGQCLCQAPAPDVAGVHTPTCTSPISGQWSW